MQPLPLPKQLEAIPGDTPNTTVFTVEPCYPGYGATLGNALRRVLLSSLPGAAATAVRIEGVEHEFSTIPNVLEDVVAILLNVKGLRFRLHGDEPVTLKLEVSGEHTVTAADISPNAQVEVANPEHPIATVTDAKGSLSMEITVGPGRGYVPVENRESERLPLGTIAVDSTYTPVRNVTFDVEHVRVEQITNFDRLKLSVTTDGTLSPHEAVDQATALLVEHFTLLHTSFPAGQDAPAKTKRRPRGKPKEHAEGVPDA